MWFHIFSLLTQKKRNCGNLALTPGEPVLIHREGILLTDFFCLRDFSEYFSISKTSWDGWHCYRTADGWGWTMCGCGQSEGNSFKQYFLRSMETLNICWILSMKINSAYVAFIIRFNCSAHAAAAFFQNRHEMEFVTLISIQNIVYW